jgi:hypothetical protein
MLSVTNNTIMQNVVMLNVVAPLWQVFLAVSNVCQSVRGLLGLGNLCVTVIYFDVRHFYAEDVWTILTIVDI